MMMRIRTILISGMVIICSIYTSAGLFTFWAMPAPMLIDLSLYPEDAPSQWILVPMKRVLAKHALHAKTNVEIREDFLRYGYTLYSGVVGYRKATLPRNSTRTPDEDAFLRDAASLVHGAGVQLDWLDGAGCTAVHQALIDSDVRSAKYLLTLGGSEKIGPNPAASYALCRLGVSDLASVKGLSLEM